MNGKFAMTHPTINPSDLFDPPAAIGNRLRVSVVAPVLTFTAMTGGVAPRRPLMFRAWKTCLWEARPGLEIRRSGSNT